MLTDFPCLRQPTELSCLPTCVRAVLRHQFERQLSEEQGSLICHEAPTGGCIWRKTVSALRDSDYEIRELTDGRETKQEAFAALVEAVEGNDIPVVVQVDEGDSVYLHAMVVVGVAEEEPDKIIVCMNPFPAREGELERLSKAEFLPMWERTAFTAFYFET